MKKIFLLLALFATQAIAGEANLSWTAPTQNTDGTAYDDPGGFTVYFGPASGGVQIGVDVPDPTATTFTVPDLTAGDWAFQVTAWDDKTPRNESVKSNTALKTIAGAPPAPPTSLTVADTTVFTIVKQVDRFVLLVVGSVPPDTPCDPTQTVNGHYAVPVADVTFTGTVEAVVVVAQCH
jgi:hypothetical protein